MTPPATPALLLLHEGAILEVQRLHTFIPSYPQDSAAGSQFDVLCDRAEAKPRESGCQLSFLTSGCAPGEGGRPGTEWPCGPAALPAPRVARLRSEQGWS